MMTKILGFTAMASVLALVAACSGASSTPETGASDPPSAWAGDTKSATPEATTPSTSAPVKTPAGTSTPTTPDANAAGQPGCISVDEHCCYGATYFRCPSTAACFGGFDIDACVDACDDGDDACDDGDDACDDACTAKQDAAGAPKGCQSVAPPAGGDCANGSIDP